MLLPDLVYYVLWRPEILDLTYSARHLFNPIRTLSNWGVVEARNWHAVPNVVGFVGLLSYAALIGMGRRMTVLPAPVERKSPAADAAGEPGSANVLY
jgi:hypothetical protein